MSYALQTPSTNPGRDQNRTVFNVVGQRGIPARHSYAKAVGAALYARDIVVPNMIFAKPLRCPYAHAMITSLDTSAAEALPGVLAVLRYDSPEIQALNANVPYNTLDNMFIWPITPPYAGNFDRISGNFQFLTNEGDREGSEVGAVVAAESEEICDQALSLIKVQWQQLPFYLDPAAATASGATVLFPDTASMGDSVPGTNIFAYSNLNVGNVDTAMASAANTLEYDVTAPRTWHMFPNPTTSIAYWGTNQEGSEGQTLYVDNPVDLQRLGPSFMAQVTQNLPADKVHVLSPYRGGKYCGFTTMRSEALTPVLAKMTGRPVRWANSRQDEMQIAQGTNIDHVKIGFNNDGTIVAADGTCIFDYGSRGSNTAGMLGMSAFTATNCPNIRQAGTVVYTNTSRSRTGGSGASQDLLAKAVYVIADKLNMDPTAVAQENWKAHTDSLATCIANGKAAINWQWHAAGTKKLADGRMHGYGFRAHSSSGSGSMVYNAVVTIKEDGKVYMPYNEADAGTNWADAVSFVIAEELGANINDVIVYFDPTYSGWLPGTATDRTATGCWVAKEAAIDLKAKLLTAAAADFSHEYNMTVTPSQLDTKNTTVYMVSDPTKSKPFRQFADVYGNTLSSTFTGTCPSSSLVNALFCEVAVDTDTGQVQILDWAVSCDAGKVIRPASFEGQIYMPVTWMTGYSQFEQAVFDPATGVRLSDSFIDERPPMLLDIAPISIATVESRNGAGCYGAVGNSHNLNDRITVSLAVYNAIGKWVDEPVTPDKVLAALGKV